MAAIVRCVHGRERLDPVLQGGLNVHCQRCYHDHTRINDALKLAIPRVRQRIAATYRRMLYVTNWVYGHVIDNAVAHCFQQSRQKAWELAKALDSAACSSDRMRIRNRINDRAALAGRIILANRHSTAKCLGILYEVDSLIPRAID